MKDVIDELKKRRDRACQGGGADRIRAQHKKGKLTARERVEVLVDHLPGGVHEGIAHECFMKFG